MPFYDMCNCVLFEMDCLGGTFGGVIGGVKKRTNKSNHICMRTKNIA